MHFSVWEKIGFGLLMTAWLLWGGYLLGNELVKPDNSKVAALRLAPSESDAGAAASAGPAEQVDIMALLATANPQDGVAVYKKCVSCHVSDKGGANKVGPALWGVLDRPRATAQGFAYSPALVGMKGEWSYEDLNHFLENPRAFAPGTKMSFAGLKKGKERADVIAYIRSLSESPKKLP